MLFWSIIGLFTLAAMFAVVAPVFRKSEARDPVKQEKTVYQERLAELDRDINLGRITPEDADAARVEIARNLIKSQNVDLDVPERKSAHFSYMLILSAIFVPVLALGLYSLLGTFPSDLQSRITTSENAEPASIETMLAAIEKRLEQQPDDVRGWSVVAPVYERMGRYDDAIKAYENLIRLSGRKPEFVFGIGEALMSKANGFVTDEALELFRETTSLDPDNAVAGFYIGVHAMQQGDNQQAIRIWQAIADNAAGDEAWLPTIRNRIAELESQTSEDDELQADQEVGMIRDMVARLEERLEENANDQQGWEMLIRSYIVMKRNEDALAAIENARNLFSEDPEFVRMLDARKANINPETAAPGEQ